ncbi:MAG TPA: DNA polymerase domain-containing protein [Bacilli bacterium]|nr:DNA polymerase domain-containing protein [Bacilli bacterium]HQM07261.1 DNA polymerase domain-containing protein [Bacilli bacterium]
MQNLSIEEFNNLDISPYQIYNLDLDYQQSFSINSYLENKNDTIDNDQLLNILFADIEVFTNNAGVFPKPEIAKFPINAITIYSTFEKIFRSYFLLQHSNINKFPSKNEIPDLINQFTKDLLVDKYINSDEKLEIYMFTSEMDLIRACWGKIREIDPSVLSGYNMDRFDLPYIYFRLSNLLNKNEVEIGKILSLFGKIKVEKFGNEFLIKIPEMPVSDLMYLYKPRDDGGLNMGSKLSSYALDFVADHELNLRKKDYKDEGMSLDTFYEKDPVNFLLYNIIDVCLCVRLNQKLKHIESYNMLRRLMKTSFTSSLRGSSILFDTYVNYKLNSENKFTRFGIVEETAFSISNDEIANLYIPKQMKQTIKEISAATVRAILGRFPGAYVKDAKAQILTNKDGIIIDLDASSLYPSMIAQLNISFDTFFGKIIDPITYNFLAHLEPPLKAKIGIPQQIYSNIYEFVVKFVDRLKPQNKGEYVQNYYLILAYLLKKISDSKRTIQQLFNQDTVEDYLILKRYLLPAIDLFDDIHPKSKEYNSFCNEYLINNSLPTDIKQLFIIENILQPSLRVKQILTKDFEEYLRSNNLMLSLSGCLFVKHEVKKGLFIEFLKNLKELRNSYEAEMKKHSKDSVEYSFYNMRQKAVKVTMNTTYGLFGQSTYRFSNKHLAKAITTQGRLSLKATQLIADLYLENLQNQK